MHDAARSFPARRHLVAFALRLLRCDAKVQAVAGVVLDDQQRAGGTRDLDSSWSIHAPWLFTHDWEAGRDVEMATAAQQLLYPA